MRKSHSIADDLVAGLVNGGTPVPAHHGVTVGSEGYVVALLGREQRIHNGRKDAEWLQRLVANQYVTKHRADIAWSGYVGVWVDGDDLVYDVVEIVAERAVAENLGRLRGQDAIYDLAERQDIHTGACQAGRKDC